MANRNGNYLGPQSYNNVTQPQQQNAVYNNGTPHRGCVTKAFMVTGILHAVAGGLCVVLGIAAIVLKAFQSYVATPIWAGLFFFIATGIIGIVYYYKPKNMCIVISYMVMTIVSAVLAGIMWIMYISFDMQEYYGECIPLNYSPCNSPVGVRVLVDSLVIVVTLLEMACAIVAATVTCFKTCKCCRQCSTPCCSDGPPSNTMIYYAANSGTGAPMMTVPVDQHNRPIYIAGQTGGAFPSGTIMIMAPGPQAQPALVHAQGQPASQAQMQPIPQAQGQTVPQTQAQVQGQPGSYVQVQTVPQGMQVQPTGQPFQTQGNVALPAQGNVIQAPAQNQMIPTSIFYPPLAVGQGTPQPLPHGQQQQPQQQQHNQLQQQGQQQQKGAEAGEHPSDPNEDEMTEVVLEPKEDEASGHTTSGQFSDQSALI